MKKKKEKEMEYIKCEECGDVEGIEIEVERDSNYGADADGNRGISQLFVDVTVHCGCKYDTADLESISEKYIQDNDL